jgi:hypothetical protein
MGALIVTEPAEAEPIDRPAETLLAAGPDPAEAADGRRRWIRALPILVALLVSIALLTGLSA